MKIALPDAGRRDRAGATARRRHKPEPELDRLSNILKAFNDQFGNIAWTDADRVQQAHHRGHPGQGGSRQGLPERQEEHRQAERPDRARQGAGRVMTAVLKDDTELFKQFSDNPEFRRWLTDTVFEEAKRNIREAIQEHLQSLQAHHQPIPQNEKHRNACRRNSPLQCLDVTHAAGYGSGHRSIPEVSRVC